MRSRSLLIAAIAGLLIIPSMMDPLVRAGGVLTGTVSGLVLEKATNQPLLGAEIFLTNMRTGATRRTLTVEGGRYIFNQVYPPGVYSLTVKMQGFQTVESTNLSVAINDTVTPVPPIALEPVSGPSTTITVQTKSAVVNLTDSARKMILDSHAIGNLPLPGVRTFDDLALLAPGVYEVPAAAGNGPGVGPGVGTAGQFSVNGQRGRNNNFLVDGSDNNDQDVGVRRQGFVSLVPQSMESVEQFQIISGNYPAEFGRNAGSIANAVSKSGGNTVHGTLYGIITDDSLSARGFFDQEDGPIPGQSSHKRGQYGFAGGGPLVKGRTFWFGSFEHQQIKDRPEKHFSVPTLDERSFFGNSPLKDSDNDTTDDLTEFFFAQLGIGLLGNAGRAVWGLVPLPNNPVGPYGANTFTQQLNGDGSGTIFSFKLDHKLSEGHSLTGRYNFTDDLSTIPVTGGGINSSIRPKVRTQNLSVFLNSVIGSNGANQARFSYGRTNLDFEEAAGSPLLFGSDDAEDLRAIFQGSLPVLDEILSSPIKTDFGSGSYGPFGTTGALGQLVIRPFSPLGVDVYNFPQSRVNNTFQYADTYTQRVGTHIFKAGFDIRRGQQNSRLDRNVRALADFNGGFSPSLDQTLRGADLASIAYATGFLQTLIPDFDDDGQADFDTTIGLRFTEYNLFFQDDWKIAPTFTFNYGIRYEFNSTPFEENGKIEDTFKNLLAGIPPQSDLPTLEPFQQAFDPIVSALNSVIDGRKKIFDSDRNNIAPRVGFAWDLTGDGKTALRAGYGLFYDQNISAVTSQSRNVFPRLIPFNTGAFKFNIDGLLLTHPQYIVFNDGQTSFPLLQVGRVNTIGLPGSEFTAAVGAVQLQSGPGVIAFTLPDKNLDTPYAQHYHLTLERELMSDTVFSVAYVGSRGVNLTRFRSPNGGISGTPDFALDASPLFPGFSGLFVNTILPNRADPRLGAYTLFENTAQSTYNSLQLSVQRRYARGLQFTTSWTWAHAIDDVSDVFDGIGFFTMAQDDKKLRAERASANFDVRHRLTSSWVWDLPVGGRHWLMGGWRFAGIFVAQTAQPFTVNSSFDVNNDGNLTDRLNTDRGLSKIDNGPAQYALPPGAVQNGISTGLLAAPGGNGAVGRNTFRARGIASLDVSIFKSFRFDDARNLEFRTEFFNVFNRTHFGVPVRILEAPSFGRSVNTSLNPRQVQFALKLNF